MVNVSDVNTQSGEVRGRTPTWVRGGRWALAVPHLLANGRLDKPVRPGPFARSTDQMEWGCTAGVGTRQPSPDSDRLLWTMAVDMAACHTPTADDPDRCGLRSCGQRYQCPGRRLAERAFVACERGWPHTWTVRHDLLSYVRSGAVPATRLLAMPTAGLPGGGFR
jgi:hypothetical protein